jgi:integrase
MARRKAVRKQRTLRSETYGKGSIYQDKKGVWWYAPPAKDGERLPRIRAVSEQEARLAQKDHLAKLDKGVSVSDIPSVSAWFEFCLREHIAPDLEESTVEWYRYLIEHYILPAIGEAQLDLVTSDHLIMLQNQLRKRLGLRTVARIHELLDRVFKKAAVSRKIAFNPMDALERPRVPRSPQKAYQPAHAAAFRDAVRGHRLELLYDLMFVQGFRRAEALALLISEYDAQTGVIKVSGQIQTLKGKTARKGKTKSDAGVRFVPLTPRQQDMVKAHLARLAEERRVRGMEWKEHGLLFPSEVGTPMAPRNLNRHYSQTQEKAGIPHYTLHATRHTAATAFDTAKATKAQQKAIMGHSPGDVTEGYIHPPIEELYSVLLLAEDAQLRWAA